MRTLCLLILLGLLALSLLLMGFTLAQTNTALNWRTVDGSGGISSGGAYTLSGSLGQPETGAMSGGVYNLAGGFWPGFLREWVVHLPLVLNNP